MALKRFMKFCDVHSHDYTTVSLIRSFLLYCNLLQPLSKVICLLQFSNVLCMRHQTPIVSYRGSRRLLHSILITRAIVVGVWATR